MLLNVPVFAQLFRADIVHYAELIFLAVIFRLPERLLEAPEKGILRGKVLNAGYNVAVRYAIPFQNL